MIIRCKFKKAGAHVYCRLWTGVPNKTFKSIGVLTVGIDDWEGFKELLGSVEFEEAF